jgi:uncharacterized phage protein (TIGR01671 family)
MDYKFRAWDTVGKVMVSWTCMNQTAFNCQTVAEQLRATKCYESFLYTAFHNPRLIKMLCIGRKDKNGTDIYDGDIVKLSDTNPVLFKVEIILGRYGYKTVFRHLDDGTIAEGYFLDKCEVFGNIYENPELLDGRSGK